ncbi:hypothetical protein CALVIDRAFT_528622 [Calocera viscosa TUFC12733]|uniref:Uncharacterized protein n=1 Tax=Calocera viscosa (strain TUFC12733) TaxID=1330018 RepID=A0A167KJ00_CALVF|nr:hypothetical protein CALVIDRAFT_528622 [Calocera viscosa TUFC12733]
MNNNYVQTWKNKSQHAFKLFSADIQPAGAGKLPPADFELAPNGETALNWTSLPPNGDGQTSGYLRFWSIPSTPNLPGSGLTFGIKIEQDFIKGEPQPYKILTYVGSPTGNPNSWTDVTSDFNPDYNFFVRGEGFIETYGINVKKLLGPRASIAVTIETLYQEPGLTQLVLPFAPDYVEEWVNESDRGFELYDSDVEAPRSEKPTHVVKPTAKSTLQPGGTAILSWSSVIPEGSGYTFGYLRYWSEKPAPGVIGGGHIFGVRLEQLFAASLVAGSTATPWPPEVKIFNGAPLGTPLWEDITEQLQLHNSYTFVVQHKPHNYSVTVESLSSIHFSRCAVRVTIKNA